MSAIADAARVAIARRRELLGALAEERTDCVRLLHGATEGAPGVAIDRYGPVLLVQTWRTPLEDGELSAIHDAVRGALGIELVPVWNHRGSERGGSPDSMDPALEGAEAPVGHELGLAYDVRPRHRGDDALLFLDLRAGRRRVRAEAAGKRVLNLFAYTCGIGVAAMAGGAREVWNVDFARSTLDIGHANAARNGFIDEKRFRLIAEDVIPIARQLAGLPVKGRGARARGREFVRVEPREFDLVVLDPPRWAKGAFGAVDVVRDYPALFKPALLATAPGGAVLATNHVPAVELDAFRATLVRCAEKAGRPLADVEVIAPEADFPSPDGKHPLKMLFCRVKA